ncbi:helix-turn-helix domain-containing protein [Oscillatoria sp. CS-180]|uniref:helix-turn-helix domain-containing protein n=1 Tax=Oscillatoria sp. CS-180 TaxID=3021720 RepID=UPI002FEE43EE
MRMGRAGRALKETLETYSISQNKLAVTMGMERTVVYRWVHERTDPTGETIVEIVRSLNQLDPNAAKAFIALYLVPILNEA